MTVLTPELLQVKKYDAINVRYLLQGLVAEGIGTATDLLVTQRASGGANLSVDVAPGRAWVQGDTVTRQGVYHAVNDATVNVTIPTPNATNPRVDQIVLHVYDSSIVGGSRDDAALEVVQGTATAGATLTNLSGVAALPDSAIRLAYVLVGASATSISNTAIRNVAALATRPTARLRISFLEVRAAQAIWTDMPSAVTEMFGEQVRQWVDLSNCTSGTLAAHITTVGSASSELRLQYSTNSGSSWQNIDSTTTNTGGPVGLAALGAQMGTTVLIDAAARALVQLRVVGANGNGTADPAIPRVAFLVQ